MAGKSLNIDLGRNGSIGLFQEHEGEWCVQHVTQYQDSAHLIGRYKTFEEAAGRGLDCARQIVMHGRYL